MTETDIPESNADETGGGSGETVSRQLVRARGARGLSQKEVADELFLTTTFIRYLDEGDFEKIPKPAFIKGYLRSYARVVGLDGNELVAAFEQEQNIAPQTPKIVDVTESAEPPGAGFSGPVIQTGVFGLIGVVVVGAIVWWIASDDAPSSPPAATEPVSEPVPESVVPGPQAIDETASPEPSAPVVQPERGDAGAGEEIGDSTAPIADDVVEDTAADNGAAAEEPPPETVAVQTGDASAAASEEAVPEPGSLEADEEIVAEAPEVQIERVTEDGINYITVYAGGDSTLGFEYSDECWTEITDGNGNQVYGDLNREGDVMTVFGQAPFDVLLGRAPAVEMTVDGDPVDLGRFTTRDDTARVRTARL